ncbi:synapse differentiation-inducing gene protein 1-like [Xenentodon cancila]
MGQQYPPQSTVTVQPTVYVTQSPLENPVDDYMCYSIFTMLCCCLPLGIAALIHSISTREANYTGNQMAAERNSRMARTLNHVALGLGIACFVLLIVYVVVVFSIF